MVRLRWSTRTTTALRIEDVYGCDDSEACNYNEEVTVNDGTCDVPSSDCQACVDGVSVDVDTDEDGILDCNVLGCTLEEA